MKKKNLYFDFETEGSTHFELSKVGSGLYIKHARPTWIAWASDDREIQVREWNDAAYAEFAEEAMAHERVLAHNAVFDLLVLRYHAEDVYRMVVDKMVGGKGQTSLCSLGCTACMAAYLNLPRALNDLAALYDLPLKKEINFHSNDLFGTSTNKEWIDYVKQDVWLLREIYRKLEPRVSDKETDLIDLHLRMQTRGIAIDVDSLNKYGQAAAKELTAMDKEFVKVSDGIQPTQTKKLAEWFEKEVGAPSSSTRVLNETNQDNWSDKAKDILRRLNERKLNELAKLKKIKETMVDDELVDTLAHASTTTNRWAGRGAHLHNFSRDGKARLVIVPRTGTMIVADLSQIEVRCGLWVAGMAEALKDLNESDWYLSLTQQAYGSNHSPEWMKELRRRVKQGVIGVMYSASVKSMQRGMQSTYDDARYLHGKARELLSPIVKKSEELYSAWIKTAEDRTPGKANVVRVGTEGSSKVFIGRPKAATKPFDNAIVMVCPQGQIIYRDVKQTDKGDWEYAIGARKGYMKHRGTLYEHVCSTIAREVLASGMLRIDTMPDMKIVATIHDEILVETDRKGEVQSVIDAMTKPVDKLDGLLIAAEGKEKTAWKEQEVKE